jgi:hypothetical protein
MAGTLACEVEVIVKTLNLVSIKLVTATDIRNVC